MPHRKKTYLALKSLPIILNLLILYYIELFNTILDNITMNEIKTRLKNLGINIKSERLRKGISQEELAEKCDISRNSISLIETGKINPTILKIIDIAKVLRVDVETLIRDI